MSKELPDTLLSQLSLLIAARMGLHFPNARWHDLERGITAAATALGFADLHAYSHSLLSTPPAQDQIASLAEHLTIGETYFFREKPAFDALREHILPELIRARRDTTRQLRVWSAGCCTGEEAYSSAILLHQLIPDWKEWMLTILATDINAHFLRKASDGVYGEWSFRDVPAHIRQRYFTQTAAGRFEIAPAIKQQVNFAMLNLAADGYPSSFNNTARMDIIFCRNVLMYFAPEQAKKVVRNLYNSLAEGGWLITGLGEASHTLFSGFRTVRFKDAILYQKSSAHASPAEHSIDTVSFRPAEGIPSARTATQSVSTLWQPQGRPQTAPEGLSSLGANEMLAADRNEAADLLAEARVRADQGELDEALAWCRRAIAADRLNLSAHYLYATIQEDRGEIEGAIDSLKRVLYLHPEFILAHFSLGCLARRQGRQREADKHFANMLGLLHTYRQDEVVPEADGLTAGQLREMMRSVSSWEKLR
ncbi:MAG: chemotaxis protein CheR [Caldilineaceae bacterium]|nr:chemotaxis protein CheR [Caldilineaceae bacterium]